MTTTSTSTTTSKADPSGCAATRPVRGPLSGQQCATWADTDRTEEADDRHMGQVIMHAVVSVDGYIADSNDDVGPLFDWYFNGEHDIVAGGPFKVSADSVDY